MNQQNDLHREVSKRFSALKAGNHKVAISIDDASLRFRVRIVPNATGIVFSFHGTANRQSRRPFLLSLLLPSRPIFNSFFPDLERAHQVAVSDPSLEISDTVRVAWFAGHKGFDTQLYLRGALSTISNVLDVERSIYFGASSGGFAALYYSFYAPGSIAVVENPQTSILNYPERLVAPYREACWPDLATNEQLAEVTCADLATLYRDGFRNTVVYSQSMGDRHHATSQMLPFIGALAGQGSARRVLLHSDFKGEHGHVRDLQGCADWVRAAALSPTDDPKDLLDTWHQLRARNQTMPSVPAPPSNGTRHSFRAEDLAVAERLRAYREAHP